MTHLERAIAEEIRAYMPQKYECQVTVRSDAELTLVTIVRKGVVKTYRVHNVREHGQIVSNWCRATAQVLMRMVGS